MKEKKIQNRSNVVEQIDQKNPKREQNRKNQIYNSKKEQYEQSVKNEQNKTIILEQKRHTENRTERIETRITRIDQNRKMKIGGIEGIKRKTSRIDRIHQ